MGPSFSRVFNGSIGRFEKFKHIIEPRWNYAYVGDYDEAELIPRFDEVDRINGFHAVSYRFINRLLAKPAEDDPRGSGAREIMSLEISQVFSLDEDRIAVARSSARRRLSCERRLGSRFSSPSRCCWGTRSRLRRNRRRR